MPTNEFYERVGTNAPPRGRGMMPDQPREVAADSPISAPQSFAGDVRRWSQADDVFWPATETVDALTPAFYRFDSRPNIGPCLVKKPIHTDDLIRLPDTGGAKVLDEFAEFWRLKDKFSERGFLHKRGILLWGPPGSGKTCYLMLMAADLVAQGGIVCQVEEPELAAICLGMIRKIEPDRPIVALLEDVDALVERWGENQYLALLDGETQVDNIVYVATTNYPERLDVRFVDRPSRFDTIRWMGMPSSKARRAYLTATEKTLEGDELDQWVKRTKGYSVAHLRELVILVQCFGRPLEDALKRLDDMKVRKPTSEDSPDKIPLGITGGHE